MHPYAHYPLLATAAAPAAGTTFTLDTLTPLLSLFCLNHYTHTPLTPTQNAAGFAPAGASPFPRCLRPARRLKSDASRPLPFFSSGNEEPARLSSPSAACTPPAAATVAAHTRSTPRTTRSHSAGSSIQEPWKLWSISSPATWPARSCAAMYRRTSCVGTTCVCWWRRSGKSRFKAGQSSNGDREREGGKEARPGPSTVTGDSCQ